MVSHPDISLQCFYSSSRSQAVLHANHTEQKTTITATGASNAGINAGMFIIALALLGMAYNIPRTERTCNQKSGLHLFGSLPVSSSLSKRLLLDINMYSFCTLTDHRGCSLCRSTKGCVSPNDSTSTYFRYRVDYSIYNEFGSKQSCRLSKREPRRCAICILRRRNYTHGKGRGGWYLKERIEDILPSSWRATGR